MSTLPPAVQAQLEAAERIEQALQEQAQPQAQAETQAPEQTAQPAPQPAPAPQSSVTPPAPEASPANEWKQRYDTLAGKYGSEVPRLQEQLRTQQSQNQQLMLQVAELTRQMAEFTRRPQEPAKGPSVDPKDAENFGSELVDMVGRVATSVASGLVESLAARVAQLEQKLTGVAQSSTATAEQAFTAQLTTAVPNWMAINKQPEFLAWLGEADPVYGLTRQQSLDDAASKFDVARVAAIFKAFIAQSTPAPAPTPTPPTPAQELARQVAPATAPATPPQPTAQPGVMSVRDIEAFYDSVRRGEWRGREQELAQREAQINDAIAKGLLTA